jgi:MFS-type transporter involved in bile tolerance (Atg22 family)
LLDYFEPRRLVPFAMILLATASAVPAVAGGEVSGWLYALCLGGAYGSQQAIGAAGYAQYFGRDYLGEIRGASFVFGISGAALGPLPFALSFDWTGSYFLALIYSVLLSIACGASSLIIRRPHVVPAAKTSEIV